MELEPQPQNPVEFGIDRRPRIEQPLPVRLVAVADMTLPAQVGAEPKLDEFYVDLLQFERRPAEEIDGQTLVYRAENFRLRFDLQEGLVVRSDYRPALVEVVSLADTQQKLIERELEFARQKGLAVGEESLLLQDPAGNWIEIVEARVVR